ncbi:MAG: (2Fe-2S)-binding protein [Acidimicrobiia bacterium]|nr:(2Fe-2S)-binding protein [Acidimicrobiia bacterium]
MMITVKLTVNGKLRQVHVEPRLTLLEVLREELLLTGTKEGCGVGECGTCVVLHDGEPVTSCLVLAGDADGAEIETIEGLAEDGELTAVQRAFVKTGALQCGFCTPAMVLTTTALFRKNDQPAIEDVKNALGGVLCRCGVYPKLLEAVTEIKGANP